MNVAGRRLAVFHTRSGWFALDDACPHRRGPLADGILADSCVACPLHDRRYDLATGAALSGGDPALAHRVEIRGEAVLVELAFDTPASNGTCSKHSPDPLETIA